jgi:hypothetical protein
MPVGVTFGISCLVATRGIGIKAGHYHRIFTIMVSYTSGIVITTVLFGVPFRLYGWHLFGVYLINTISVNPTLMYSLMASNVVGYTKSPSSIASSSLAILWPILFPLRHSLPRRHHATQQVLPSRSHHSVSTDLTSSPYIYCTRGRTRPRYIDAAWSTPVALRHAGTAIWTIGTLSLIVGFFKWTLLEQPPYLLARLAFCPHLIQRGDIISLF